MARKAVATTLAAVALMTLLVVADATVLVAQGDLASSSEASRLESRELLIERSYGGLVSLQALAQVQGYLSSDPAECAGLAAYFGAMSSASSVHGLDSGVYYDVSATISHDGASDAPLADNLTSVAPFSGGLTGALDLTELLTVSEASPGGSVSLDKRETHSLNVPIEAAAASYLCSSTLFSLRAALSRPPCNASLVGGAFDSILPLVAWQAYAQGFRLTAGWALAACVVDFWFTLVEPGVPGPAGSFDWTVRGSGTAG